MNYAVPPRLRGNRNRQQFAFIFVVADFIVAHKSS
jgi:hypothetical protein